MNLIFISDNYPPEQNALAQRASSHIEIWKKKINIDLITCFPNYPYGKIFSGYKKKFFQKKIEKNLTIHRIWSFIAKKDNSFLNFFDYASFGISSFFYCLNKKSDIILCSSPPMPVAFFAILLSKIKKTKIVIEIRDLWVDSIVDLKLTKNFFIISILKKMENFVIKNSNLIICVTENMKLKIKKSFPKKRVLLRTNGYQEKKLKTKTFNHIFKHFKKNKSKINFTYLGTIGLSQDFDKIFNFCKKLDKSKFFFNFIGTGSEINSLKKKIREEKLPNFYIFELENPIIDKRIYDYVDYGLSSLKNIKTFKKVVPSKIYEYIFYKKKIIFFGPNGETSKLIQKLNIGHVFTPRRKINRIQFNKKPKFKLNNQIIKSFSRKLIAKKILNDLQKLKDE
ncbi:glycosyltransferase family 4 protein [Candidatus Pelagibacter communis]|uniref:glycosyltransferase family 4 protein n=1 Tax=Pelagibacter ubique TaxID=198252 RepID=UPI00094C8A74|nr:glycosyltransferase family 4 protein [Candidatus Pelagibacter ubique]